MKHTLRYGIKQAIRWYRIAQETGNRELAQESRAFVQRYFPLRNNSKIVLFKA